MRLISRHLTMNPDTFAPEMEIVLRLPMEITMDTLVTMTDEEFQNKLGHDLFELMRTKE